MIRIVRNSFYLAWLAAAVVFSGCKTYQEKATFAPFYACNDLARAEREVTKKAESKAKGKDAVIYRLEEGTILRATGKLKESNDAFEKAEERINKYSQSAKVSVSSEAEALLSNQAELPYRGRPYDGIMMNTYKALNYLQLNDPQNARVELNRAYERQKDAVEENKRRIEKTEAELAKEKNRRKIEQAQSDPHFNHQLDQACAPFSGLKAYADYVNPFTVYLDGLFQMAQGNGFSDWDRARRSFQQVLACDPDNQCVKQDLELSEGLVQGKSMPFLTYVIFETGRAPTRDQIRIDVPIIFTQVSYVGAAFPKLTLHDNFLGALQVSGGDHSAKTEVVANVDAIVAQDFKNELPTIITKTIASTISKAAVNYGLNEALGTERRGQSDGELIAGIFLKLSETIYDVAVNIADLRTWTTLPKEFQVCRIPTPADRRIFLSAPYGGPRTQVNVADGVINVVLVKSITAGGPLSISQFRLK